MSNILGTATIRDRGQLTIPGKIRNSLKWPKSNSVVSLAITLQNELIIKPYQGTKYVDWSQLWTNIHLSRSYKGEKADLSTFIASDRENH